MSVKEERITVDPRDELDYDADWYEYELGSCIKELSGNEEKAVTAPSITEENSEQLPDLGASQSTRNYSRAEWEDLQRTVKKLAASRAETKNLNSSLTAIRGEMNKLKRPSEL